MKTNFKSIFLLALSITVVSCNDDDTKEVETQESVTLKNHSQTPAYLAKKAGFENLEVYSLLSSEDQLSESPNFVYGSMADGMGLMKLSDGTYSLINNIEADYSIARISFDKTFKPVKGEYILNAAATARTAQCSGSLIMPEEHGFGPLYLSGGEWGGASKGVFATDPFKKAEDAELATLLPALGQWSTENAVVIGKDAYPSKTVAFIGDDTGDNTTPSGQFAMYIGNRGDLASGKLYGLKVTQAGIDYEMDMQEGVTYPVVFEEYTERTLNELEQESRDKGIMGFSRVEDIDYRKGSGSANREIYFAVTGRKSTALTGKGTFYGRIYKVVLDANDPKVATITCVLDGDNLTGVAKQFHSPDNIVVTKDYAYIMEDPNGYPDTADKTHFPYLYQYNLNTKALKVVLECDQNAAATAGMGSVSNIWELTGMIDVSDVIGVEGSFLICTQNHGWTNSAFTDAEAISNPDSSEGSQLFLIKGLER
ncbi:MAG: phosphatase [Flavobacterium sp.]|uniref:alkaline phosphatase PhoX n=1 Tax=unclassified Flavobacterium TaxID=196869 RepID=UPI000C628078|nr:MULTISPECIES: alkaline phosphatase PhoX [unclassified Flavobacterium]MBF03942.1 phosphatase [Flavobacterium sp.]MCO6163912.1 PhoX family protein [Flavobacterium sp. NRK F7]